MFPQVLVRARKVARGRSVSQRRWALGPEAWEPAEQRCSEALAPGRELVLRWPAAHWEMAAAREPLSKICLGIPTEVLLWVLWLGA